MSADKVIAARDRERRRAEPEQEVAAKRTVDAAEKFRIHTHGGVEFIMGNAVFFAYPKLSVHRCVGDSALRQMCISPEGPEWYVLAAFSVANLADAPAVFDMSRSLLIGKDGKKASPVTDLERGYTQFEPRDDPDGGYIFAGTRSGKFEIPARKRVMVATVFRMPRDPLSGPVVLSLPVPGRDDAVNIGMELPEFFRDGLRGDEIQGSDAVYLVAESIAWSRCVMGVKDRPLTCAEDGSKFLQLVLILVNIQKPHVYNSGGVKLVDGDGRVYESAMIPVGGAAAAKRRKGEVVITEGAGTVKIVPGERHALVLTFKTGDRINKPLLVEIPTLSGDRLIRIAIDKVDEDIIAPFGPSSEEYNRVKFDDVFQEALKKDTGAPVSVPVPALRSSCCKSCTNSQPCGDGCISFSKQCHQPPGCAC